jgi:hypothetical protein
MNECKYDSIPTHKKQMKGLRKTRESYAQHIKRLLIEYEDDIQ